MPTNTYVALDKATIGTATSSVTISSINSGYTDLVLVASIIGFSATDELGLRINADTGSSYSRTFLYGNGTSALSSRNTSLTEMRVGSYETGPQTIIMNFMNYSNTTTYKTMISMGGGVGNITSTGAHLWSNTNAISSITIRTSGGANFAVGSTFSLYGIASEEASAKATGGMVISDSTYWYHTFTSTGAFVPKQSLTADVLVIAGGGGGGKDQGGGGGAGGLLAFTSQSLSATSYTCTVGAGGAGSTGSQGVDGVDSQFGALTLVKGGGGGGQATYSTNGRNGGSGGGGGTAPGAGTSGQGNGGGYPGIGGGGGGGGAGAVGQTGGDSPGNGGAGSNTYSSWATATSTGASGYYAGGGGGGAEATHGNGGTGGAGGGGTGGRYQATAVNATVGLTNTGGGGGGGQQSANGAAGGSGLIIVRYLKA